MRLERMSEKTGPSAALAPMTVSERTAVLTDGGGEFFVSVTRDELAGLLARMDAERARGEAEFAGARVG